MNDIFITQTILLFRYNNKNSLEEYYNYTHLYEPYVLRHDIPRSSQMSGDCCISGFEHSSMSTHVFQSLCSCNPSGHTQNAEPIVFMHWCEQPAVPSRHSSTSSQVCPSSDSLVPGISWHEHLWPPHVLVHVPWHGPCPLRNKHSSISEIDCTKYTLNTSII